MDFHALSRRELQALCKRNAVRANMSNAAMADALQALPSVDGLDEIGRRARPAAAMKSADEAIIEEEQTDGSPLPRGGRARSKARTAAADKMDQDVRDQVTLHGSQGAGARDVVAPVEVEEVIGQEQGHRCPLPRGGRARVKTRKAAAHKEEATVLVHDTLEGSQRTAVGEGMALVETEATGKRRTRRSARSKMKMALDQKGAEEAAVLDEPKANSSDVAIGSGVVSDKSCDDTKTHEMVLVVEKDVTKDENVAKRPVVHEMEDVPAPAILRRSQRTAMPVEAEEVATAKKRTRRSRRTKVAAAAPMGRKQPMMPMSICADDSSEVAIGSTAKSCDFPKENEVVAVVEEEATKPLEGGNDTRRTVATEVPAPATLQRSQRTSAPEAAVPVEAEEVAPTKRRRRRGKSKVAGAVLNAKKDDSSDAVAIGSLVLVSDHTCDDSKEEQLVAVVEKQVTKPKEVIAEEQKQRSIVRKSASMVKVEDPPTISIFPKVEATDIPDKTARADEETIKEDACTVTCEVDQSNLLVNTLSRFAKPMHKFTVKAEKKEGGCWWMLM
ncbi:uncharacterized protein C2845_PM07G09920 [Panicum miliaceum]|uniref:Uncharacterized protein n=1 Tax=Panicum miliaceum TaxID=4540 RepID=A0A3L6SPX9_PANMI|nr:uncharacterized protein C2845_PM07G09920 [Panicum miliaceum]